MCTAAGLQQKGIRNQGRNMSEARAISIRVLVIDDHRTMREIIRRLLAQGGIHDVEEAENGEQALDLLRQPRFAAPDVILCDLYMDKMDGLEFCNTLRRDENLAGSGIPIIILTGDNDPFMHEVTRQIGAATVLVKPVSADVLKEKIEAAVGYSV